MATATRPRLDDPRPQIFVDGREQAALRQGLLALSIVETTAGLYRCEVTIGNYGASPGGGSDFLYFDRKTFDFGKSLKVALPDGALFDGRITALEARFPASSPPALIVLAEDRLQDLRMTRRTRTFPDASDADVFGRIAQQHGLAQDVRLTGGSHAVLAQVNQSDLAFLRERARAIGAELWIEVGADGRATLKACSRSDRNVGAAVALGWHNELQEFDVIADLAEQRTSVTATGWDPGGKSQLTHEATARDIQSEVGGDDSGPSLLREKLGERKESIAHGVPLDSQEARARATSHFQLMARRFVVGRGVARTDPRLRVGRWVDLAGLGPLFTGKYYLSEVRHCFDGTRALRTEFIAERPGLGRPS
jgi:phage protein D